MEQALHELCVSSHRSADLQKLAFCQRVAEANEQHKFVGAIKALSAATQVNAQDALQGLLECLLWCCQPHAQEAEPAATSPVVQHLLLEALPTHDAAALSQPQLKAFAVQLMLIYCANISSCKMAAKVASTFRLGPDDLDAEGWQQLSASVPVMLQQPSSYKAAVNLMMQFEGLDEVVDRVEVLTQLVADGQDTLAQQWATSLGRDYQISFVEACVALDRLKPAARAVRQLHLAAEFPNVEALYRQRSLSRLISRRLWSVAQSYAGNDVTLQTQLVRGLAEVGEHVLAEEYRVQAGLPPDTLAPPDPAELAAQEAARRAAYLQLDLPPPADGADGDGTSSCSCLLWVDDADGCRRALQALSGSSAIGLDVEWRPSHVAGVTSPAALLQVASHKTVVLFDLLTLCQHHAAALDACLSPLLSDGALLKLGFEVAGDLSKLASSWPSVPAFRVVAGVLDLRPLFVAYGLAARLQGGSARALSSVGLSTLCQTLLGKPLDKSQQMSDWERRPLTDRQQTYAALDAYVLPQLFDVLQERLGPEATQQLVKQHTKTFSRPLSPTSPTDSQQRSSPAGSAPSTPAAAAGAAAVLSSPNTTAGPNSTGGGGGGGQAAASPHPAATEAAAQGEARVLALLQQHGLQDRFERLHLVGSTSGAHITALDTAAAAGVPPSCVAKTMTLMINHQPHLVVTRGDQRIDMHKLAALLGVKRRAIVIAPEPTVAQLTGFKSGVPPVGHSGSSMRVIVDERLRAAAAAQAQAAGTTTTTTNSSSAAEPLAAAAAPATADTAVCSSSASSASTPISTTRGGGGVVAAMALMNATQQPQASAGTAVSGGDASTIPAADTATAAAQASSSPAATNSQGIGDSGGAVGDVDDGGGSLLAVQCGPSAVLHLSFEQLLQLSGGAEVADVADASATSAAVSTLTGAGGAAAAAAPGVGPSSQGPPKFLLDSMLGRLCRWLRALGVDTEFVEPGQQGAHNNQQQGQGQQQGQQATLIQQINEATLLQGRLFITQNQSLAMRRDVVGSVFLLSSNDTAEQLAELSKHFGVRLDEATLMSRCGVCNAAAYTRISHEEAAAHVSARLLELVQEFWQCGRCGKVVWMGPKSYAALELLEGLFKGDGKARATPLKSVANKTA